MKSILIFAALVLCANAAPTNHASALVETENSGFDDHGHELYQGDMVLDENQKAHLNKSSIDKRKAHGDVKYRWPANRVPYTIDASSEGERIVILEAIQHWQDNTCIEFQAVVNNFFGPRVIFKKLAADCWSRVGRIRSQYGQDISIGYGCERFGTVVHEIGHALGFYHEQSRPDRGEHVVVLDGNVETGKGNNFNVETNTNNYSVPYDVGSIMHYGPDFFAINNKNTIVTKDPWKHFLIGQRDGLSFADIKLANLMYNCAASCKSAPKCVNNGFVDKNCRCVCPPGFSGATCQGGAELFRPSWTCGDYIYASYSIIQSPNYPNDYPADTKCIWEIRAPPGKRVQAVFDSFELEGRSTFNDGSVWCSLDVLELRMGAEVYDGDKYCGNELQGQTKISATRKMNIVFYTQRQHTGFEAVISFV